jgi:cation:H+ antiporter
VGRAAQLELGKTFGAGNRSGWAGLPSSLVLPPARPGINSMIVAFAVLIGLAVLIYLSCEAFVNGIEWVGHKFKVGETATGSILAAFGTALPESVVTLVATAFGGTEEHRQLGVGAALGGPLALSTVAYGVVGLAMIGAARKLGRRQMIVEADSRRLARDQAWFLAIFAAKIALGVMVFAFKPWLGLAFLAAYAAYTWTELRDDSGHAVDADELEPLLIRRGDANPGTGWVLLQTLGALAVIFIASHLFVEQMGEVGPMLGLSPHLTALLISPIATELPETMNALIWVRQGKERLALANISGAMMIQATVPTAFGLFFTPWQLDRPLLIAAGVTALATAALFLVFRRGQVRAPLLACAASLYLLFAVLLVVWP